MKLIAFTIPEIGEILALGHRQAGAWQPHDTPGLPDLVARLLKALWSADDVIAAFLEHHLAACAGQSEHRLRREEQARGCFGILLFNEAETFLMHHCGFPERLDERRVASRAPGLMGRPSWFAIECPHNLKGSPLNSRRETSQL